MPQEGEELRDVRGLGELPDLVVGILREELQDLDQELPADLVLEVHSSSPRAKKRDDELSLSRTKRANSNAFVGRRA